MKTFLTTLVSLSLISITRAQIPNTSFEEWQQQEFSEEPLYWKTNNGMSFYSNDHRIYVQKGLIKNGQMQIDTSGAFILYIQMSDYNWFMDKIVVIN